LLAAGSLSLAACFWQKIEEINAASLQ
jgi:hypothetical protein